VSAPLYYQRQLVDYRSDEGAPKLVKGRQTWKEAQREAHKSLAKGRLQPAGKKANNSAGRGIDALPKMRAAINDTHRRAVDPEREPVRNVELDYSRLLAGGRKREGSHAGSPHRLRSILTFEGWSDDEVRRVRRCLRQLPGVPYDRAGQQRFFADYGFAEADAARLAGADG
jgi:hypothetical protein